MNHGLAEARHVVIPAGIVSSALPAVQATCAQIGQLFDPWQVGLNRAILAKDAFGLYAADTVVISIPRQVGKTYDIGALVFADCIINPGTTTVWTAHRFKVSRETFDSLRAIAKSPLLAAHIDYDAITTAAGNECIPFRNGSRIVFAARERGAIRGFTKVRRLILDEAQILTESALADMVPTMNQAVNPQIILMGTPPKPSDPGEVFTNLRHEALSGTSEGILYVEFSAEKGSNPDDRKAWSQANPSYPQRTPAKAILRMKKLLGDDNFRREGLGIWDSDELHPPLIPADVWHNIMVPESPSAGIRSYGVKFAVDGSAVALAVAIKPESGPVHVEVIGRESMSGGMDWLVKALVKVWREAAVIVIDGKAGVGPLVNALHAAGVQSRVIVTPSADQVISAHAFILEAIETEALSHFDQAGLNDSISCADKRDIGKLGGWGWKSIRPDSEVLRLDAVTLAHYGAMTSKRKQSSNGKGRIGVLL